MTDRVDSASPGGSRKTRPGGIRIAGFAVLAVLLASLAVTACAGDSSQPATGSAPAVQTMKIEVQGGGSYTDVNAAGLAEMLKNKDFPLINVHIPYEGELEGTDAFIPYNEIAAPANLAKLPANKDARIVLYCRSDSMSNTAARELVKLGYTDVWNLDGGFNAWKAEGRELLNKGR